jgi:dynein heavy chain 1
VKSVEIKERTEKVNHDLGQAEPALVAAKEAVSGLKDKDVNELKSLRKPPAKIQYALEPVVALLLGLKDKPDWAVCFA